MHTIIGILLLMTGAVGTAWAWCREEKIRLSYLRCMKQTYEYLQNEMLYAKTALPDICGRLGRRQGPFRKAFEDIYDELNKNSGCSFEEIWTRHMTRCTKELHLKKQESVILIGFPASLGYRDGKGQAEGIGQYIEDASRCIKELEAESRNKNKVVMCLGVTGGIMAVILLL